MHPLWLLLSWQGLVNYGEWREREGRYEAARAYAIGVGKPLLVVGGPLGGPFRKTLGEGAHGYGDVCLDVDGRACAGAPPETEIAVADVRQIPYPDKWFGAALVSHVLEHLPTVADARQAVAELHRVADAVFVAGPSEQSLIALLHPGHKLWVAQRSDGRLSIEQRA